MKKTEFVESYIDAWNHCDPKGIADHFSADGIYLDVPESVQNTPEELIVALEDFFANFRHRYELIGEVQKSANTIAFQYRMFSFDDQKGATLVANHGAEFIALNGNAAITITDYYDIPVKTSVNKYAKSGLTGDQLLKYKQRLNHIMRTQREYLRPDLTLPKSVEQTHFRNDVYWDI